MKIEYWPEEDMLHLSFGGSPQSYVGGEDSTDPDVVFHYDRDNRIVEIEISNVSTRMHREELERIAFRIVRGESIGTPGAPTPIETST